MNKERAAVFPDRKQLLNIDVFVLINLGVLLLMIVFVYFERFEYYRGPGNAHEFLLYAVLLFALIGALWLRLRKLVFSNTILVLLQIGIFAHFAGAYIPIDGQRLYDAVFFGMGYDKYVHFFNAFAVAALINQIFQRLEARIPIWPGLIILLLVLGLGAIVEIVEYIVVLTIPDHGVGDYHDNMRDMIANLAGGATFVLARRFWQEVLG